MHRFLAALIALASIFALSPSIAETEIIGERNRAPVDCSGTITTGNQPQNLLPASKIDLHGLCILNIDATEDLWFNLNGTAAVGTQGSYSLAPKSSTAQGGSFCTPPGLGVNTNPSIIASSTGHKFTCTWW